MITPTALDPRTAPGLLSRRRSQVTGNSSSTMLAQRSASASTSWHIQDRFRFAPERFTELSAYQAIALPFHGDEPSPPTVLYLTRDFSDPNESWFDWRAHQIRSVFARTGRPC